MARLFPRAVASFRPLGAIDHHAAVRLEIAERRGLQFAILCRTVGFGVAGIFYVAASLASGRLPTAISLTVLAILTGLGIIHYIVIGTRFDRPFIKYVAMAIDIMAICGIFVFVPLSGGGDIPQIHIYRGFGVYFLFPFVALSALSLSPRLVVWAGVMSAIGWLVAFSLIVSGMGDTVSWSQLPSDATQAQYEEIVLSPNFVSRGSRMVEALAVFISSVFLALAVARARHIFVAQVRAEQERERERGTRHRITQQLGRFVPASIARRLVDDPSGLKPQVRHGAVLVMDIRDFTAYAAGKDPADVITELNKFLSEAADAVAERDGVVITFTGDGLLATFNTPLEVDAPEAAALDAARTLVECAKKRDFVVRVGMAAGPIAAGSVGSAQRQAFTVYGDTVNRAARLEQLGKDIDASVLADAAIAAAQPSAAMSRGRHALRGFRETTEIFEMAVEPAAAAPDDPLRDREG
ncbi:MAG: adenylate/guanylate cyclase domain-containing protein [Pseudomonadota bacterium]